MLYEADGIKVIAIDINETSCDLPKKSVLQLLGLFILLIKHVAGIFFSFPFLSSSSLLCKLFSRITTQKFLMYNDFVEKPKNSWKMRD